MEFLSANMGWIVSLGVAVVGLIVWLVRLESRANTNSRDIERESLDRKETVTLTNARITLAESQIAELRVTTITRSDLKDVEGRLSKSIDGLGDRVATEVNRLIAVMPKTATRSRSRSED